jgi:beta-glucuronidase
MQRMKIIVSALVLLIISFSVQLNAQIASLEATFSIKTVDGAKVPFQNGFVVPTFDKQDRAIINLKGDWKKQRFAADDNITLARRDAAGLQNVMAEAANRYLPSYNDSAWQVKTLPAVENTMYPYPTVPEYYEDGVWYRRTFTVDSAMSGQFVKLMFYSVNYVADVWVNGTYLGYHEGGYTPFAFDVSSVLNYGGTNTIAVRVDNPAWGTRNDIVPFVKCDWFNYTGIIHDVYLEVSAPVSVMRTNIIPKNIDGTLQTQVVLYNRGAADQSVIVTVDVYNADVNNTNITSEKASALVSTPASLSGTTQTTILVKKDSVKVWQPDLKVLNPRLWSPKDPNLYVMKVSLLQNGKVIDTYFTQFGVRTVRTAVDKVRLNEKSVFFTGVARHEDHPTYGRSIPTSVTYEDLLKAKGLNANYMRTAHYPNHLFTYQLADRMGIAIMEEIPVWWFDSTFCWVIQNSVRHIHQQMFREMVFKDLNRPSILLWSTCNECLDVTNRKTYIAAMKQDMNFNYPDGRLVTESAAADRPGSSDASQAACDVAGWTMYFGIFHGGTYYDGTRMFVGEANLAYPEKPIMDTEFGYWSGEANNAYGQSQQDTVFNQTFAAFTYRASVLRPDGTYRDGGYLMGVTWWCLFDWYSSQHPTGFESMGLYKMTRDTLKKVGNSLRAGYAPFYNVGGLSDVQDKKLDGIPAAFELAQNYPNPFNPETKIVYSLPKAGFVTLKVYNILGREVATLFSGFKNTGTYEQYFDAGKLKLASGIYVYKLESGGFVSVKKMMFLK